VGVCWAEHAVHDGLSLLLYEFVSVVFQSVELLAAVFAVYDGYVWFMC
jgi:hypothetical protein